MRYAQTPACANVAAEAVCEALDANSGGQKKCYAVSCTALNSTSFTYDVTSYYTAPVETNKPNADAFRYRIPEFGQAVFASEPSVLWKLNFRPTLVTLNASSTTPLTINTDVESRGVCEAVELDHTFSASGTVLIARGDRRLNGRVLFSSLLEGLEVEATFRIQDINQAYAVEGHILQSQNVFAVINSNGVVWSGDCAQ